MGKILVSEKLTNDSRTAESAIYQSIKFIWQQNAELRALPNLREGSAKYFATRVFVSAEITYLNSVNFRSQYYYFQYKNETLQWGIEGKAVWKLSKNLFQCDCIHKRKKVLRIRFWWKSNRPLERFCLDRYHVHQRKLYKVASKRKQLGETKDLLSLLKVAIASRKLRSKLINHCFQDRFDNIFWFYVSTKIIRSKLCTLSCSNLWTISEDFCYL